MSSAFSFDLTDRRFGGKPAAETPQHLLSISIGRLLIGPFPIQICLLDFPGALHGFGRNGFEGPPSAIAELNRGLDLQPFPTKITDVKVKLFLLLNESTDQETDCRCT